MSYGTIALILFAVLILTPLSRILLAALFGRSIGKSALSRQPDAIHLRPLDPAKLRHGGRIRALTAEYLQQGFEDAGVYTVPEMPGVNLQLLAHRADSMYAVIYDHPAAGVFYDIVSRFTDGSAWTYTTARTTGTSLFFVACRNYHG